MVPTIGLMVGMYILFRVIDIGGAPTAALGVKIMGGITFLFTLLCMAGLLMNAGT